MGYENKHALGDFGNPTAAGKSFFYTVTAVPEGSTNTVKSLSTNPLNPHRKIGLVDLGSFYVYAYNIDFVFPFFADYIVDGLNVYFDVGNV